MGLWVHHDHYGCSLDHHVRDVCIREKGIRICGGVDLGRKRHREVRHPRALGGVRERVRRGNFNHDIDGGCGDSDLPAATRANE